MAETPFLPARLVVPAADSKDQRWFISYYAWHPTLKKLKKKKYYGQLSKIQNLKQREITAAKYVRSINSVLKKGVEFDLGQHREKNIIELKQEFNIEQAFQYLTETRFKALAPKTRSNYEGNFKELLKFLLWQFKHYPHPKEITPELFAAFIDTVHARTDIENQTKNNIIERVRIVFGHMKDSKIITQNPCESIKKLKTGTGRNIAYNDKQVKILKPIIQDQHPALWNFIQFLYYGLMRPDEVRQLQIFHIDILKHRIYIPGKNTKIGRGEYIEIWAGLMPALVAMNLEKYPEHYFIFGNEDGPGKAPLGVNTMYARHKRILEDLNFTEDYTLYSWTHTGAVAAYEATKDIKAIQKQKRHKDIRDTDIYLKSLGLIENRDAFNDMKRI
ncbi:MAG: tyrosine-type recombinase/integrase [Bacteroidia bacterium]